MISFHGIRYMTKKQQQPVACRGLVMPGAPA